MGFWDMFVKVWQVRTSVKIQDSLENSIMSAKEKAETQANIPKIIEEITIKNTIWDFEIEKERKRNNEKEK
ncbi:MAG: hypothetical protein WCL14_05450 [Bacteroidota bacterium]